jgi:hypothetical protein
VGVGGADDGAVPCSRAFVQDVEVVAVEMHWVAFVGQCLISVLRQGVDETYAAGLLLLTMMRTDVF